MPSERIQRRIDALLDEADEATSAGRWTEVIEKARAVMAIEAGNEDAAAFLQMAEGATGSRANTSDAPNRAVENAQHPP